ncbi:MAG: hypothetical protein IJB73_05165 [Firmicutes bacterium]|nr:hypothetical protein [Bacillota bacterium]
MSEPRLQNQLEYLAYKIGHIGWGYIFMYLDVNLGTIDILPSWAGYLFILSALPVLSEYEKSAALLRNLAILLTGWAVLEWVMTIFGITSAAGSMGTLINIAATIIGVVSIYFHFQMLTNLAEIAGQLGLDERKERLLKLRTVNTILHTVLAIFSSLAFLQAFMWLTLGLALINFVNTLRITICLFGFKSDLLTTE